MAASTGWLRSGVHGDCHICLGSGSVVGAIAWSSHSGGRLFGTADQFQFISGVA